MPEKIKYSFSMDSAVPIGADSIESDIVNKVHVIEPLVEFFPQAVRKIKEQYICYNCYREIDIEDYLNNFCPHCNKSLKKEMLE